MLRTIRIILAIIFLLGITALFVDFTGSVNPWLGWMAKVQFLPAVLALNVLVVVALVAVTLLLGRAYCSVVCPLGVMQDVVSWISGRRRKHRHRFSYSPERKWLRYGVLALFIVSLVAGIGAIVALLSPYGTYGMIVQNFLSPVWIWVNNQLADMSANAGTYTFYHVDWWMRSTVTFTIAAVLLVVLAVLAWRNGRTYCNTICPVGTVLSFFSRFAWLRPYIDTDKCNGCGLCGRSCKASCIDSKNHKIDYTRCVACMDCLEQCRRGAISYRHGNSKPQVVGLAPTQPTDSSDVSKGGAMGRRTFLALGAGTLVTAVAHAREKRFDGGVAAILDKEAPRRRTRIVPPGAESHRHFYQHCVACQLCVAQCPQGVLRPSASLDTLMQPEASYERGYCRPECTRCSEVCPAGAIRPIDTATKSSTQVGHAVWVRDNCVVLTDEVACDNCAHHCPAGAIMMVALDRNNPDGPKIPAVDETRCIGCGACENLCPARPFSAIYVEGHERHKLI